MLDRKLIDYLPPVLQNVMEFAAITSAQQPEIEAAWDAVNLVMDNQFINTATEAGVTVWEKELNIVPLATDTLEDRKQRLKIAWTYGVVYTYNWLADWLKNSCGNNNPRPTIEDYVLKVNLPVSVDYPHILADMRRYVAANVLIDPLILLTEFKMTHYVGSAFRHSIKQSLKTDEWDNSCINILTDENQDVLVDGADNLVLYEEVTA